jgi:hypothetical protein
MADGDNLIVGNSNFANLPTRLERSGNTPHQAFAVANQNGNGIRGQVLGSNVAVRGDSPQGIAIHGESFFGGGVFGRSTNSVGVTGDSERSVGVHGSSNLNGGVLGVSRDSIGVFGETRANNRPGISGQGSFIGAAGEAPNGNGVFGRANEVSGNGVRGVTRDGSGVTGTAVNGFGVRGLVPLTSTGWGDSFTDLEIPHSAVRSRWRATLSALGE